MAKNETRWLTAHIRLPLADKVDELAARLERWRGWVVKQALKARAGLEEERSRLIHEAMTEVKAGQVIDHDAVQAWADGVGTDKPLRAPVMP